MAENSRVIQRRRDLNLLRHLLRYQDQVERFRMRPFDYEANIAINRISDVSGAEFCREMKAELQTPSDEYLRIFRGVFHGGSTGEALVMVDHTLFLYPVSQYILLRRFLWCENHSNLNWNWADVLEREQAKMLASLTATDLRMRQLELPAWAGNAYPCPSSAFICFLSWCQEIAARFTMPLADFQLYTNLTYNFRNGSMSYSIFEVGMRRLLRNPCYESLRVWWEIHQQSITGMVRFEEHPLVLFPLDLCVRYCVHRFCAMFGYTAWDNYLNSVWRQRGVSGGSGV